jgi:putative sterol carrier protein
LKPKCYDALMDKLELFSEAWVARAVDGIRSNAAYQKAATTWEGAMVLSLQADPSLGVPEARGAFLDLWHGECRGGHVATPADAEAAQYIISADAFTWKQVFEGKLEPITGLLRGKLKLTKGNMIVLAKYVMAAKALVSAATEIPTKFPGE